MILGSSLHGSSPASAGRGNSGHWEHRFEGFLMIRLLYIILVY